MIYTTENLVSSVKRRSLAPTSQNTFQDADIISFLNEELQGKIVPEILSAREDYFLNSALTPVVQNVELYPIPERAIGNALKDVWRVGTSITDIRNLMRFSLADKADFASQTGDPVGYYLHGDSLGLLPIPNVTFGSVQCWYLQRASELVATTSCARIVSISNVAGTCTFTVDTDLTGSLSVGAKVDFLNSNSPNILWAQDVVITAITISSIAVASTGVIDSSSTVMPLVGNYICPAKQSNIPTIPQEFMPLLAERAAARIIQALGHNDKLANINQSIAEMHSMAMKMISNRVESDSRAIVNSRGIFSYVYRRASGRGLWRY